MTETFLTDVPPQAGAGAEAAPARGVDDFLAHLDATLAEATAPSLPAPELAVERDLELDAATATPDTDLEAPAADAVPAAPATASVVPERDWWSPLYRADTADLDTFTGNAPAPGTVAVPPKPGHPPGDHDDHDDQDDQDDQDGVDKADGEGPAEAKQLWFWKIRGQDHDEAEEADEADESDEDGAEKADEAEDPDEDETGGADTEALAKASKKSVKKGSSKKVSPKKAKSAVFNHPRGRQVLFAGTAYAMGRSLGLDDWAVGLMEHAPQYAIPVTGCALGVGILGLTVRTKFGGILFVSSLAAVTVLEMVDQALVVGGGLALGLQIAYRIVRHWTGHHGDKWP
ncbi:hypothetical protein [Streptomyces sp. NPDC048644]|uniref:hypothetical protein n=1 Tax=Streptomyces sp. NPDC048644 TaxID=3365582 RepID=UPI0037151D66